jgi:hypothetical protein
MSLEQEIYNLAIDEGFSPSASKLIVAQSKFESANYASSVFNKNNNMYGMKFVGQPLASRGSLAPYAERSSSCQNGGSCVDRDYYAKYNTPLDSAKDVLQRLYKKERNGIGFEQLKNVKDADEFAKKLKTRNYFGFYEINTEKGFEEAKDYARGLVAKLKTFTINEYAKSSSAKNNYLVYGSLLLVTTIIAYAYYRKNYR